MTDSAETASLGADGGQPADVAVNYSTPASLHEPGTPSGSDRPEVAVGAAFAGGFLAALILKRIAR